MIATQTIELSVSASLLKKALSFVGRAVPDNAIVPITSNVLFDADGGVLTLTGSDLSITQKTTVPVEYSEPVGICIPYKELSALMANLPDQPLTMHIDLENLTIRLKTEKGRYKLTGEPAQDYPQPQAWTGAHDVNLSGAGRDLFFSRLGTTLFAVTKAGKGLVATECVCWSGTELVATNGQILARMKGVAGIEGGSFRMPTRTATLLATMGTLSSDDATIRVSDTRISCKVGEYYMESPLVEHRFPDYQLAFPDQSPIEWTINRLELIGALKRTLVLANETSQQVQLTGEAGELTLLADNIDYGTEAIERISAEISEPLLVCASGRYLIDCLSRLTGETVTFQLSAANRPMIIVGDELDELMLVMPIIPKYAVN